MIKAPSLRFRAVYAARPSPFRISNERALSLADSGALLVLFFLYLPQGLFGWLIPRLQRRPA